MPVKSKAIIRAFIWSEFEKPDYEVRIFRRPDGKFTKGNYDDDEVPDTGHTGDLSTIEAENINLIWGLLTGEEFDV